MKENHKTEEEKWGLLAGTIYDTNKQATGLGKEQLVEELFPDPKEREQLLSLVEKVDLFFQLKKYPADQAWTQVEKRISGLPARNSNKLRRLISNPLMRVAAALLVAAMLFVPIYETFFSKTASTRQTKLLSAALEVKSFTLPDGTLVSLNSHTILKYPLQFGSDKREVSIEGEAFFEVKPDQNKPFIIHAGNAQINVLGTSFNVSAYPNVPLIEVTVETGKVQVLNKAAFTGKNNRLILDPGEKGTLEFSSNALQKTTNNNPNFLAWKTRHLIFRATSLAEVISTLENVYKVNIRFEDSGLSSLLLTAQFNDHSLDFILKVIETTLGIETQKIGGQYILKSKS